MLDGRLEVGYAGGERTVTVAGGRGFGVLLERRLREHYAIVIALGTVVGGATGGLIGAGIGYLTPEWEQRFP